MATLTPDQEAELKAVLVDLKMSTSRFTLTLGTTSLLVEIMGWAVVLEALCKRLAALHIDFEQQATIAVTVGEVPGQVVAHDLDTLRIPDDLSGVTP